MNIPKKLHMIWIGPRNAPMECIQSWQAMNPGWEFKLWGNDELASGTWRLEPLLTWLVRRRKYGSAADLMRYELLYRHGGFYADADSTALRPLDDALFTSDFMASWESEEHQPGQIANGFIASVPGHPILHSMIEELAGLKSWPRRWVWKRLKFKPLSGVLVSGPKLITRHLQDAKDVGIWPSRFFNPQYYGVAPVELNESYAVHHYGSMNPSLYASA